MSEEEKEVWRTYPDYPVIEASNLGRIRTKDRYVTVKGRGKRLVKGKVLKQHDNGHGYLFVHLSVNGNQFELYVHRVIATCFLPNPLGLAEINHIDNNPANNRSDNLEWCSRRYNVAYREKYGTSLNCPVIAVNPETSEVFWFESQHEAGRQLGIFQQNISIVVRGEQNKTHGFWFCYADENSVEKARENFGDEVAEKVEKLINEKKRF